MICRKPIKGDENASATKQSNIFSEGDHRNEKFESSISKFVGVMAYSQLRRLLHPTEFRLYYLCPERISNLAEVISITNNKKYKVPIRMPLKLAYMSSSGKLYQFGFNETLTNNGSISWQLDLRPFNTKEQPIFKSLQALIKYYESYANIHRKNATIENFPIDEK
uniref:FERM domain-containing protein n=1 Tax=Ascaris lumbricoides TaxID=6252 RepID=A0A0M3IWW5_ASCLU